MKSIGNLICWILKSSNLILDRHHHHLTLLNTIYPEFEQEKKVLNTFSQTCQFLLIKPAIHKLVPSKKIGVSDGLGLQECMATINYGQEDELQVTPLDFWIETDLCV